MANPIISALGWIEGTLLGTIGAAVAVIAVAWIGFLMLSGRIDVRQAANVIVACFIIFGASTIAAGIQSAIFGTQDSLPDQPEMAAPPPPRYPAAPAQAAPSAYDPYAGSALPPSR